MSVFDKLAARPSSTSSTNEAQERFIVAVLKAAREYDRATKPDGRRNNGKKRVDPRSVERGLEMVEQGNSIRSAARIVGVSFGTLWKLWRAEEQRKFRATFKPKRDGYHRPAKPCSMHDKLDGCD